MSDNYYPKFHDIASDVFPKYKDVGFILDEYKSCKKQMIQDYINKNSTKFHRGDILFVGSIYQTRQYSEAFMIIDNHNLVSEPADNGTVLPILYRDKLPEKIYYKNMFEKIYTAMINDIDYEYDYYMGHDFFGIGEGENINSVYANYQLQGMFIP